MSNKEQIDLQEGIISNDIQRVKDAIKNGANVNKCTYKMGTPLMLAAVGGRLKAVELLIQAGADVNASPNRSVLSGSVIL